MSVETQDSVTPGERGPTSSLCLEPALLRRCSREARACSSSWSALARPRSYSRVSRCSNKTGSPVAPTSSVTPVMPVAELKWTVPAPLEPIDDIEINATNLSSGRGTHRVTSSARPSNASSLSTRWLAAVSRRSKSARGVQRDNTSTSYQVANERRRSDSPFRSRRTHVTGKRTWQSPRARRCSRRNLACREPCRLHTSEVAAPLGVRAMDVVVTFIDGAPVPLTTVAARERDVQILRPRFGDAVSDEKQGARRRAQQRREHQDCRQRERLLVGHANRTEQSDEGCRPA